MTAETIAAATQEAVAPPSWWPIITSEARAAWDALAKELAPEGDDVYHALVEQWWREGCSRTFRPAPFWALPASQPVTCADDPLNPVTDIAAPVAEVLLAITGPAEPAVPPEKSPDAPVLAELPPAQEAAMERFEAAHDAEAASAEVAADEPDARDIAHAAALALVVAAVDESAGLVLTEDGHDDPSAAVEGAAADGTTTDLPEQTAVIPAVEDFTQAIPAVTDSTEGDEQA